MERFSTRVVTNWRRLENRALVGESFALLSMHSELVCFGFAVTTSYVELVHLLRCERRAARIGMCISYENSGAGTATGKLLLMTFGFQKLRCNSELQVNGRLVCSFQKAKANIQVLQCTTSAPSWQLRFVDYYVT